MTLSSRPEFPAHAGLHQFTESGFPPHSRTISIVEIIEAAADHHFDTIADHTLTPADFNRARKLGYQFFQGNFYCQPDLRNLHRLATGQMQLLRVLQAVNRSDFHVRELIDRVDPQGCRVIRKVAEIPELISLWASQQSQFDTGRQWRCSDTDLSSDG